MSRLKEKSNINHASAKILIEKHYYASSVHCSYYSVFQLLKYLVSHFNGFSYDGIAQKIQNSGKGSHVYIIDEILELVKGNRSEYRFVRYRIKDLKHFRVQSDYEDIDIDFKKGSDSFRIATELRDYFKEKV